MNVGECRGPTTSRRDVTRVVDTKVGREREGEGERGRGRGRERERGRVRERGRDLLGMYENE